MANSSQLRQELAALKSAQTTAQNAVLAAEQSSSRAFTQWQNFEASTQTEGIVNGRVYYTRESLLNAAKNNAEQQAQDLRVASIAFNNVTVKLETVQQQYDEQLALEQRALQQQQQLQSNQATNSRANSLLGILYAYRYYKLVKGAGNIGSGKKDKITETKLKNFFTEAEELNVPTFDVFRYYRLLVEYKMLNNIETGIKINVDFSKGSKSE